MERVSGNVGIEFHVEPRKVITWEEFILTKPEFSMALDGYVYGPPRMDLSGPWLNLNHHEGVDRLATKSTSGQMFAYIKAGLFKKFSDVNGPRAILWLNDPDQDSALSSWLAVHHERLEGHRSEPLINRLIFAEDNLDATAGAYPIPLESELMRQVSWIFDPYTSIRENIPKMNGKEMENVIESIHGRINSYTLGHLPPSLPLPDDRYEKVYSGKGCAIVKEI